MGSNYSEDDELVGVSLGNEKIRVDPEDRELFNADEQTPANAVAKLDRIIDNEIKEFNIDVTFADQAEEATRKASQYELLQERLLVNSDKQIQRFIGAYKCIDRILEIDETTLAEKDPIIEYIKLTKLSNMPPHRIAFKKMREKDKMEEEDEDEENIAYNLSAINITTPFAHAFSQTMRFNPHLNYLIL